MVTNKWFIDSYNPSIDFDEGGNRFILGGYTKNRNTPTELMGAIQLEDGSFKLFWVEYEPNQYPSSISFHEKSMGWSLPESDQEALYEVDFGGEPGWEGDLIRDVLNGTFFSGDTCVLSELLSSTSSWDQVKARLLYVAEILANKL